METQSTCIVQKNEHFLCLPIVYYKSAIYSLFYLDQNQILAFNWTIH